MISSIDLNFTIPDSLLGIVVERKDHVPTSGETFQLYIPILMPNIGKSIPSKSTNFVNKGPKLFLNDSGCRPTSRTVLKTQNYLSGVLEHGCDWDIFLNIKNNSSDRFHTSGEEKIECYPISGKLSKLQFNTDTFYD